MTNFGAVVVYSMCMMLYLQLANRPLWSMFIAVIFGTAHGQAYVMMYLLYILYIYIYI